MTQHARTPLMKIGTLLAVPTIALFGASMAGSRQMRQRYEAEKDTLERRGRMAKPQPVTREAVARLPLPLQRYLQVTHSVGNPGFRVASVRQRGALRSAPDKPWMSFAADQVYSLEPPGFVWLAKVEIAPLVRIWARDKYVEGQGHMLVRALGALTLADARGEQIDQGAGLRHWGEVISFPEAVLSPHLRWEPISEDRVRMRASDRGRELVAEVAFDREGYPYAVHAQRYRDIGGGKAVLTPWSGLNRNWKSFGGRAFPTEWESVWHLPEGDFAAVRLEILSVSTE